MANNPEDEEHHPADRPFEQPNFAPSDQAASKRTSDQQATGNYRLGHPVNRRSTDCCAFANRLMPSLVSVADKTDAARISLRPNLRPPPDDCQSSKPVSATICDCECCFSNSIQLSSSIVHIDENDSEDDEYLDAEAYTTANSTVEDEDAPPEQPVAQSAELTRPNLVNSKNSFNAISSNLYFGLTRDEQFENFTVFAHNGDERLGELSNHPTKPSSLSFYTSNSSLIARTAATLATTTTVTCSSSQFSNHTNESSSITQKPNKCHCRLTQASFTAKQRPLSLSSISSSSSSCCSLNRNNSLGKLSLSILAKFACSNIIQHPSPLGA